MGDGLRGLGVTRVRLRRAGGQKSRVALAKVTFQKPHILLLDEPSNHLDIDAVEALIQVRAMNG